jgi:hypothetical protein
MSDYHDGDDDDDSESWIHFRQRWLEGCCFTETPTNQSLASHKNWNQYDWWLAASLPFLNTLLLYLPHIRFVERWWHTTASWIKAHHGGMVLDMVDTISTSATSNRKEQGTSHIPGLDIAPGRLYFAAVLYVFYIHNLCQVPRMTMTWNQVNM